MGGDTGFPRAESAVPSVCFSQTPLQTAVTLHETWGNYTEPSPGHSAHVKLPVAKEVLASFRIHCVKGLFLSYSHWSTHTHAQKGPRPPQNSQLLTMPPTVPPARTETVLTSK